MISAVYIRTYVSRLRTEIHLYHTRGKERNPGILRNPRESLGILEIQRNSEFQDSAFSPLSERQILRRLPRTGAILFTIRPYFIPLIEIAEESGVPGRLASAIRSWPDDLAHYKGKEAYQDILLKYLDEKHQQQCDQGLQIDNSKSYPY